MPAPLASRANLCIRRAASATIRRGWGLGAPPLGGRDSSGCKGAAPRPPALRKGRPPFRG